MLTVETSLYGGIKTWGMILLFAWSLSFLSVIYETIFDKSLTISNTVCDELIYLKKVIF